jgi:cell division protein FtsB
MSRTAAATAARSIPRSPVPAAPRRVSGPAGPPRRDPYGSRSASRDDANARARSEAAPRRAARAHIDPSALAYADGGAVAVSRAVAAPLPRPSRSPRRREAPARRRPATPPRRLAYGGVAIASRMANVAIDVSTSRLMDRLVRSRVWIGVIAVVLIGIVAMQVSMLKLNASITSSTATAGSLEQSNAAMRRDISRLSSGDRIEPLAEAQGFVMPAPDGVGYLDARHDPGVAARAAQRMTRPDPATAGFGGAVNADEQLGDGVVPADGTPAAATTTAASPVAPASTSVAAATSPAATPSTSGTPATSTPAATGTPTQTGAPTPTGTPAAPTTQATAPPPTTAGATAAAGATASGGAQATPPAP